MAKSVKTQVKIQITGGAAKPSPPIGPALGQHGVAIMDFCRQFNLETQNMAGEVLPTVITIYDDRSFSFKVKSSPASTLLMKAAGQTRGSSIPNKQKVGRVTWEQCKEIAQKKMADLTAKDLETGAQIIAGTARSMGYIVDGHPAGRDDSFTVVAVLASDIASAKEAAKSKTKKK